MKIKQVELTQVELTQVELTQTHHLLSLYVACSAPHRCDPLFLRTDTGRVLHLNGEDKTI